MGVVARVRAMGGEATARAIPLSPTFPPRP